MNKCPSCQKSVMRIQGDGIEIDMGLNRKVWNGVVYRCPHCKTIFGCQIDPIAIVSDLKHELLDALRKGNL